MNARMLVIPAILLGTRYYDINVDIYLNELRVAFAVVLCLNVLYMTYLYFAVGRMDPKEAVKTCAIEKPKVPFAPEDSVEAPEIVSYLEHDSREVKKIINSTAMTVLIIGGIHYYKASVMPLLIQSVSMPLNIVSSKLFQVYVLGRPAVGDLARPWKVESPFADLQKQFAEVQGTEEEVTPKVEESAPKSKAKKKPIKAE